MQRTLRENNFQKYSYEVLNTVLELLTVKLKGKTSNGVIHIYVAEQLVE